MWRFEPLTRLHCINSSRLSGSVGLSLTDSLSLSLPLAAAACALLSGPAMVLVSGTVALASRERCWVTPYTVPLHNAWRSGSWSPEHWDFTGPENLLVIIRYKLCFLARTHREDKL